jgi:hypothetical protein
MQAGMRSEIPLLTKSDYIAGLQCPKRLYLKKYQRELEEPPGDAAMARMADGIEVGVYARLLFPGGLLVSGANSNECVATTLSLLDSAHTLFEAQFVSGGRTVKVDILQKCADGWKVIEVKSSKMPRDGEKCKELHVHDIAFQVLVLREAGIRVSSASLMLLSRDYVAPDTGLDMAALFGFVDVTNEVGEMLIDAQIRSIGMLQVLSRDDAPAVETNTHCKECGFQAQCGVGQSADDLLFLPGVRSKQITEMRSQGLGRIGEIPNTVRLTPVQSRVRNVFRDDKPFVDEKLVNVLGAIQFPIYFIDFEATKWVIPTMPGTESYQALPFQWSCHVLASEDAEVEHYEFLHRGSDDPRPSFAQTLWERIQGAASVFVYSSYEMTTLRALNRGGFVHAEALCQLLTDKGVDLLKIVQENLYLAAFRGSFSIKKVLPAMVPSLGYEDLKIREGEVAANEYKRMIAPTTPADMAEEIAQDLLAYCRRDTQAMVELFYAMCKLSGRGGFRARVGDEDDLPEPDDTKQEQLILNI